MTDMDNILEKPILLIDDADEEVIDETAWVQVTPTTMSAEAAVAVVEDACPLEDRAEEEHYVCEGKQEWLAPGRDGLLDHWHEVDPTRVGPPDATKAQLFWVVKVACKI